MRREVDYRLDVAPHVAPLPRFVAGELGEPVPIFAGAELMEEIVFKHNHEYCKAETIKKEHILALEEPPSNFPRG
jgi:hypothetical protein